MKYSDNFISSSNISHFLRILFVLALIIENCKFSSKDENIEW